MRFGQRLEELFCLIHVPDIPLRVFVGYFRLFRISRVYDKT